MAKIYEQDRGWWHNYGDDLIFGSFLICFTCSLGCGLRAYLRTEKAKKYILPTFQRLLGEGILAAEFTVFGLEMNYIIWDNFPLWIYFVSVFLFTLYMLQPFQDKEQKVTGNPVFAYASYLKEEISWGEMVTYVLFQDLGALIPYGLIVKPLWAYSGYFEPWKKWNVHADKLRDAIWDSAVLKEGPVVANLSECIVTMNMYLASTYLQTLQLHPTTERYLIGFLNSIAITAGGFLSGAYYNPAVATGMEIILTEGTDLSTNIFVYWCGPLFGITLGVWTQPFIMKNEDEHEHED